MGQILFYERPGYFYSNFSSFRVTWRGIDAPTSEYHYQAAKFTDPAIVALIYNARSSHEAFKLAKANDDKKRPDWHEIKLAIMEDILRAKLAQHAYIRRKLLESGDAELVEDSPKDSFWGRGADWKGHNHLGKLWMKLRTELRETQKTE